MNSNEIPRNNEFVVGEPLSGSAELQSKLNRLAITTGIGCLALFVGPIAEDIIIHLSPSSEGEYLEFVALLPPITAVGAFALTRRLQCLYDNVYATLQK